MSSHWRNTTRPVKVGPISALSLIPLLLLVFIHSMTLLWVSIAFVVVLGVIERFNWSLITLVHFFRAKIGGKRVSRKKMIGNRVIE